MAERAQGVGVQRVLVLGLLALVGIFSLPVSASFLDGEGTENLILPVALIGVAVVGAAIGAAMPGFAGEGATRTRAAIRGALIGLAMCLLGLVIFFLLLSGFGGA